MYSSPSYLWVITLIGMVGIPALTCLALYRGTVRADLGRRRAALVGVASVVLLGGWFTASGVIAGHGGYHTKLGQQPPWLPIAAVTTLVVLWAVSRIPLVARVLAAPGMLSRLELVHTFRVAGVAFVLMMAIGRLPVLFALPAGLGDMAVGIAAPFVARSLARGTGRRAAVWFNALGIADLVVALALGGLTGFQLVSVSPPAVAIGELPLALIPTAAVPLLLVLHIVSLRKLAEARRARAPITAGDVVTVG
ncbi:MAG TPA: hypothetical protein VHX38_37350 [Pseudonocardiaceae bacterium]|jgi:hypothetical protein|nr:hypothetical protein [Pseudonocardiaceae bacterium]